jgi:hypothetical protein
MVDLADIGDGVFVLGAKYQLSKSTLKDRRLQSIPDKSATLSIHLFFLAHYFFLEVSNRVIPSIGNNCSPHKKMVGRYAGPRR